MLPVRILGEEREGGRRVGEGRERGGRREGERRKERGGNGGREGELEVGRKC